MDEEIKYPACCLVTIFIQATILFFASKLVQRVLRWIKK